MNEEQNQNTAVVEPEHEVPTQGASDEVAAETPKMFTQEQLDEIVSRSVAKARRSERRKTAEKDTGQRPSNGVNEEPTLEALAQSIKGLSDKFDQSTRDATFNGVVGKLDVTPSQRNLIKLAWKQSGYPDLSEFISEHVPDMASKPSAPIEASAAKGDKATQPLLGAKIDAGAPSALRDSSTITDPKDIRRDDLRRIGIKKAREIVEGHYDNQSDKLPPLFPKRN